MKKKIYTVLNIMIKFSHKYTTEGTDKGANIVMGVIMKKTN